MLAFTTILVFTDFSAASDRALPYARQVAAAFGASLHILHVVDDRFASGPCMDTSVQRPVDHLETFERQSRVHLKTLLTDDQKAKYSAELITRTGPVAEQILEYIGEHPIDLVVMATAGPGSVSRLTLGGVTDEIVRAAPCPVLTVHPYARRVSGVQHHAA